MSSILVVEPENSYRERIHAALGADGWRVREVSGPAQALQAAAVERPDLVIVSTAVPGAEAVAGSLSRSVGGPGVVGLLPEGSADGISGIGADDLLAKPFTDQELRQAVQRALAARPAPPAAAPAASQGVMLTSRDIFGDVLAEVEAESPDTPETAVPFPPPEAKPRPAPPRPAARPLDDDEINRKLEKTVSGVLGMEPKPRPPAAPRPAAPAAPPPPPRRPEPPLGADVDALLNKTLSTLDLTRPRPAAPRPPAPVPPPAAPPAPKPPAGLDLSSLEELARPTRPAPPRPAPVAPPAPAPLPEPELPELTPLIAEPLPELPEPFADAEPVIEAIPEPPEMPEPPPLPLPSGPVRSVIEDVAATQRIEIPPLSVLYPEEAGNQPGERFGQYTLLEKIAAGGMAEVWKARMRGVEGFQKTVAIKKILAHMTDNSEFVGMFIDEAKLAAQLSHPNIVHIYDLGKIGRDYYIAMEFVEGKDLRSLMNAGRRKGLQLPMGLALFIAARLASALDYAHRKRDFEDRDLGLVHRDVSPQNVLLSQEGDVKLCDFGIAKAVSKAGQTQMGALKGKLQYMSPEQAWGRAVDFRSDIFSLGAVLFEMLTGERLFTGETEISVLEAVRQGQIRSTRQIDASVPAEVDEIVARALAYDPQSRFASAGEMKQRIESVLHALGQSPGPTDLAAWVQRVLEEEPGSGDWSQPGAPVSPHAPIPPIPMEGAFVASEPLEFPELSAEPGPQAVEAVAPLGEVHVEESAPRSRGLLYAIIAALIAIAILTFFLLLRRSGDQPAAGDPTPAVQSAAPKTPPPAASPAPTPAAAAPALSISQEEIDRMIKEGTAKQEEELRRAFEARERKLREELAKVQAETRKKKQAADAAANEGKDQEAPPPQR